MLASRLGDSVLLATTSPRVTRWTWLLLLMLASRLGTVCFSLRLLLGYSLGLLMVKGWNKMEQDGTGRNSLGLLVAAR